MKNQSSIEYSLPAIPDCNNFGVLRLILATIVFIVHAEFLTGEEHFSIFPQTLSSALAVKAFFIVSGFLIFMSYEKSGSTVSYFEKRLRRIYPAYFFVIISCALLGGVLSSLDFWGYVTSGQLYRYIVANLLFLNFIQPDLPGVFTGNRMVVVNGALWTLKIEVMFYCAVPVIVWMFRRLGVMPVIGILYLFSVGYSISLGVMASKHGGLYIEAQRQLPGQLCYFIAGACGYYYFHTLKPRLGIFFSIAIILFLFKPFINMVLWHMLEPFVVATIVMYFVFGLKKWRSNFGGRGDFSYGVYIVHFPVLQLFVSLGWFKVYPWAVLGLSVISIFSIAYFLWHKIEKPFLRKGSHYINPNLKLPIP